MGADARGAAAKSALESIVSQLPGGERRDGQLEMCEAVADALDKGEHLVVEAGTGVGKSLAYLVAAVLSGRRVVVATARKPLQDQLINKDIPFIAAALPGVVDAAVLKGRSNYLCLAKLAEANSAQGQLAVDTAREPLNALAEWARASDSGDLAGAPIPVDRNLRTLVTVGAQECPGGRQCAHGDDCLAERALERARDAQLVVTNIDLYCLDVAIGGGLLGEHDAVVIDEAHELEPISSRTLGLELGRRRLNWLASQLRGLLVADAPEPRRIDQAGDALAGALASFGGRRVDMDDQALADALAVADTALSHVVEVLRKVPESSGAERDGRRPRCLQAASSLLEDVRAARVPRSGDVAWVPDGSEAVLHIAPVDVGPVLSSLIHSKRTTILTSATLSVGGSLDPVASRLGLGRDVRKLRVASPFDYSRQSQLYCAAHLPDPRRAAREFDTAALAELATLVEAAGGRTLALFTTHRMLRLAAETLRERFEWPVLVQDGPPEPGLIERFRDDEQACLLATMGYWQGVDIAGPSLSLVVIDRLPFPPLRDPLLEARRDAARAAGGNPFEVIDLPVAATLLAQGAGRLIRSTADRGVVAVLDRRLATAGYRRTILDSLPPMRRMVDGDAVREFLTELRR
ncbi:MAG TPA: ATP-dependent DNA helicase [Acidimicrobiales bacterium]|nr:ATP-dependent DNA helicase [Acidimicrobiales bacterium]